MTKRQNRMALVAMLVLGVSLAGYFALKAFNDNLLYFFTPTDVVEGRAPIGKSFRMGGLVETGSVVRDDMKVSFILTDTANSMQVDYVGILPDLFREGQGIVATGSLSQDVFVASEVLAKHDENYMPPEVADALEKAKQSK
jgi:cytochrome c-type biogenesis protein CcmE